MKLFSNLRVLLAAAVISAIGLFGGIVVAQNANQVILTMLGSELIQVQSPVNNTAAIAYTSVASLRDGRMWVYLAPLTGFTLALTPLQSAVSLNPAGTIAAGTVTLPATTVDGKVASIFTSNTITALTINTTNSATFVPAVVTTLTAGSTVSYVYDKANNQWHRIQ